MLLVGNASALLSKDRRSFVLKKINFKGTLTFLAAKEFPDAKKNLFGDGFEERLKARSVTAKTLFQAANVGQKTSFFRGRTTPFQEQSISRGWRGFNRSYPRSRGSWGRGNQPNAKTSNSKSGKYSLHFKYCRPQFKFKTFRPSLFAPGRLIYKTLLSKLAINLQRPLGFASYRRLSHRLHNFPLSDKASSRHYPHSGRKQFNRERSSRFIDKKRPSTQFQWGRDKTGLPATCFLSPKKGVVRDQPFKAFKSIREVRALQNGEYSHATRSTKKRQLSGQNRFEGCLLHGPYLGKLPEISEVSLEGDSLRVCMPSTPTCFSPAGFHQGNESKPVVGLLRQLGIRIVIYLDDMLTIGQTQERAKCHATTKYKPPRKSEVHCQLPEVSSNTFNHNRISGVSSGLKNFEFISSKGEDKECQKGMPINSRRSTALNTTTFPIVGLPNFHHSGSLSCTNSFSVFTNRQNKALSTCQDYSATFSLSQHAKDQLIW